MSLINGGNKKRTLLFESEIMVLITDIEISELISEKKSLPLNFSRTSTLRTKRGHKEFNIAVIGENGSQFRLLGRQSSFNNLDFSIILLHVPEGSNQQFRIRRYNGKSHEHTNKIEKERFYDFHIHTATQRYQEMGFKEDEFAEPTDRYGDYHGALTSMLQDCGFIIDGNQRTLLDLVV
jgi:hypothetical protein